MNSVDATNTRLMNIHARRPAFSEDLMRLMCMTYHVQKIVKYLSKAALHKYGHGGRQLLGPDRIVRLRK